MKTALRGRPSLYEPSLCHELLVRLSAGESVRKICRDDHMPTFQTVFNWLNSHDDFFEQYTRARSFQAEVMLEEILDISERAGNSPTDPDQQAISLEQAKILIDTRKWVMGRMNSKRFGEKTLSAVSIDITQHYQQDDAAIIERYAARKQIAKD